jgi:hypothetical protein
MATALSVYQEQFLQLASRFFRAADVFTLRADSRDSRADSV